MAPQVPDHLYDRYEAIFEGIEPPYAFVDLGALESNSREMLGRAAGKPIRVASKSIRCREIIDRVSVVFEQFCAFLGHHDQFNCTFTLEELVQKLSERELLGEVTLVLGPAEKVGTPTMTDEDLDRLIDAELGRGRRPRDVADEVALVSGRSRRDVYTRVIERKRG